MLLQSCLGKKRRAQWSPSGHLVIYILAITVLVLLLIIYGNIGKIFVTGVDKEACKQSIRLNAYTKLRTRTGTDLGKYIVDPYGNAVQLQCATEYLEVRGTDPEVLKNRIADSMVDCWQMYGEGDLEVFDTEDNNYCAVCSRLEFKEETRLPGFTQFLTGNVAPMQDTTYMEYFKQAGKRCGGKILPEEDTPGIFEESDISKIDTIDTSSPLAVMFVMGKNAYPNGFVEAGEIETAGLFLGIGAGAGLVTGVILCATGVGCAVGGPLIVGIIATGAAAGIAGGVAGGIIGYGIGSSCTANYDAYVMLWNYSDLKSLDCTYLESESTPLKIREI